MQNSNVSRRQSLKRKFLDEELCQVHHSGNELMKSSSPLDAYNSSKHRKQCSAPLLSSKDCTEPLSGIDSELVPLNQERKNAVSEEELAMQHITLSDELKTYTHPTDSRPMFDVTEITRSFNEETGNASRNYLGSYDEVEDGDCLKLLSLDNPIDEEIYRAAIKRPLSPTLPEIGCLSVRSHKKDRSDRTNVVSPVSDNIAPFSIPDEEIDFSKLNASTSGTCHVPLLAEKVSVTCSHEIVGNIDVCLTSDPSNTGHTFTGQQQLSVSSGSNPRLACSPHYYVIFSDISSNNSICKISSATRTCMAQCSMLPQTDHVLEVMSTLLKVEGLQSR